MPGPLDRFLTHSTVISRRSALGRVLNVTRESWRLSADPKRVRPRVEAVAIRKTASEAADLARAAAEAFPRHGFHKPSGSWWGADDQWFHRFVVHTGRRRYRARLPLTLALAGVTIGALARARSRHARRARRKRSG